MKLTLLDLTQNILSSLGSDEVNSYSDTTESRQVAEIIRTTYFNIIARAQLPEQNKLFSLDPTTNHDLPVLMYRPDFVSKIIWIKYDISEDGDASKPNYQYVNIVPLEQFLHMTNQFDIAEPHVLSFTFNNYTFNYKDDRFPTYCTIIQDAALIFDSFNADVDDTLQDTKSLCFGQIAPTFIMEDNFLPELDDKQFPLLLNEAKSLAFAELKQMPHEKAEQESRRQWRTLQHSKHAIKPNYFDKLPFFGRKK